MTDAFVNQVTLDCLLNKEMYNKHIKNKRAKANNREERKFYKKRTFSLFKDIITGNDPKDLLPDVKYAYENFVNSTINYFKTIDKNDLIQAEYNEMTNLETKMDLILEDDIKKEQFSKSEEADKLMMRSIKIDIPTLDKYVTRISTKKKENIILPKQKNINLQDPELKNKGIKKKNITNKYEDNTQNETFKKENENENEK